jgi:uncharacterized protein
MGPGQSRRTLIAVAFIALMVFAANGQRIAIFGIDQYRAHISPRLRGVVTCRFTPTCSAYGREAILKYGLARGGFKTAVRIARCGPWTRAGTVDKP